MKIKCFNVEELKFKDGTVTYKVWFSLVSGVGWLYSRKPVSVGQEVEVDIVPMSTTDVKTNMRLGLRIV